jgi:predicted ATP-grasp superfamily ATP-dependent carboligase
MNKPNIFITDGRSRATLVMSKFLKNKGIEINIGEERRWVHSFFSKNIDNKFIYPSIDNAEDDFFVFMQKLLKKNHYDVLFPIRDPAVRFFAKNKEEFSKYTKIPVADYDIIQRCNNKLELAKAAIENGLPVPNTYLFDKKGKLNQDLNFPLIIRPAYGSGSRGVKLLVNDADYKSYIKTVEDPSKDIVMQDYIPHDCEDQYLVGQIIDEKGESRAHFVLKKLREYPYSGGPMTAAVSMKVPKLVEQNTTLLRKMNWYGMSATEYIYDKNAKEFKLTEINTRFYGALGTSLYSGVNFPYILYKIALGKKTKYPDYEEGVLWRWLYPGDLLAFFDHKKKSKILKSFIQFKKYNYAILSLNDPGAAIGQSFDNIYRFINKKEKARVFNRGWKK